MKKILLVLFMVISLFIFFSLFAQNFTYVGASKCKICHQTEKQGMQFPLWQNSGHSKSFAALSSEKALEIGKSIGIEKPAESPECLKCHASLHEKAPELDPEGVTCEVCHGPGSEYRKLNIMKDKELSAKNGLILYGSPEAINTQCLTCHRNAHGKTFDFPTSWEKVKHPVPEK